MGRHEHERQLRFKKKETEKRGGEKAIKANTIKKNTNCMFGPVFRILFHIYIHEQYYVYVYYPYHAYKYVVYDLNSY